MASLLLLVLASSVGAILIIRESSRSSDVEPADQGSTGNANITFWERLCIGGAAYAYNYDSFAQMKRDSDQVVVGTITSIRLGRIRQSSDQIQLSPGAPVKRIVVSDAFFNFKVDEVIVGQPATAGALIISRPISEIDEPGARAAVAQQNRSLPSGRVIAFLKTSDAAPDGTPTYFLINEQAVWGSTPRSPTDQVLAAEGPDEAFLIGVGRPGTLDALVEAVRRLP
jgi:hypothetical protein